MVIVVVVVIICILAAALFLYAALECEDQQGIFLFSVLCVVALLLGNVVGVLGLIYKVGGL